MIEPKTIGLGVLLAASAGGISWMWASDSTQAQAKIELAKDELCQLHERLVKLHPMAEPPALFEFLDLDAYGPHFHPPEVSLHPESKGYEEAKRFIVQKASEKASLWYEEQNLMWGMESERVNKGGVSSAQSRRAAFISAVAEALYDDDKRGVYIKKFLPILTSYRWNVPWVGKWGRREWNDETEGRMKNLAVFCKWNSRA